jgi:hypothetical protein
MGIRGLVPRTHLDWWIGSLASRLPSRTENEVVALTNCSTDSANGKWKPTLIVYYCPAPLEDMAYYMARWGREVGRKYRKQYLARSRDFEVDSSQDMIFAQEGSLKPQALATSLAGLYAIAFVVERLSS